MQLLRSCCQDASFISNERIPFPKKKIRGWPEPLLNWNYCFVGTSRTSILFPIHELHHRLHELHHRLFLLSISKDDFCNVSNIYPIFQCFILDDQIPVAIFYRVFLHPTIKRTNPHRFRASALPPSGLRRVRRHKGQPRVPAAKAFSKHSRWKWCPQACSKCWATKNWWKQILVGELHNHKLSPWNKYLYDVNKNQASLIEKRLNRKPLFENGTDARNTIPWKSIVDLQTIFEVRESYHPKTRRWLVLYRIVDFQGIVNYLFRMLIWNLIASRNRSSNPSHC